MKFSSELAWLIDRNYITTRERRDSLKQRKLPIFISKKILGENIEIRGLSKETGTQVVKIKVNCVTEKRNPVSGTMCDRFSSKYL
jgi:hypothetical protein